MASTVVASNENNNPYAIMRTRFQPFTVAHHKAIETFFNYADTSRTFGRNKIWLGIVDPELSLRKKNAAKRKTRVSPGLNPLREWQISEQLHAMTCVARFNCDLLARTRIPSFIAIRQAIAERIKDPFRDMRNRVPTAPGRTSVWYFPIFDREDLKDIGDLWTYWHRSTREPMPPPKIVIWHHPGFSYDIREDFDPPERRVGPYAAATAELLELKLNGHGGPLIPDNVRDYVEDLSKRKLLARPLEQCRHNIQSDRDHPLWDGSSFDFVQPSAIHTEVHRMFNACFKGTAFEGRLGELVEFLPTEPGVEDICAKIAECLRKDSINGYNEVREPPLPTENNCKDVIERLLTNHGKDISRESKGVLSELKNG